MKKVIYTALTGGYDNLIQPSIVDNDYDYICFTDLIIEKQIGVWKIRQIPNITTDLQLLSRFPKMHPHVLLGEYDYSIYIDSNVCIDNIEFYKIIDEKIKQNVSLSGVKHPQMNCSYKECFNVIVKNKCIDLESIKREFLYLKSQNFPENYGMYEANVIYRDHHHPNVIAQCEEWWYMICKYAKRDQLAYSYTLWHHNIPFDYLVEPDCQRKNRYFKIICHRNKKNLSIKSKLSKNYLFAYFWRNMADLLSFPKAYVLYKYTINI